MPVTAPAAPRIGPMGQRPPSPPGGPLGTPPAPPELSTNELARGIARLVRVRRIGRGSRGGGPASGIARSPAVRGAARQEEAKQEATARAKAMADIQHKEQRNKAAADIAKGAVKGAGRNIQQLARAANTRRLRQAPPTAPLAPTLEPEAAPPPPDTESSAPSGKQPRRKTGHLLGPAHNAPANPEPEPYRGFGASGPLYRPDEIRQPSGRGIRRPRKPKAQATPDTAPAPEAPGTPMPATPPASPVRPSAPASTVGITEQDVNQQTLARMSRRERRKYLQELRRRVEQHKSETGRQLDTALEQLRRHKSDKEPE